MDHDGQKLKYQCFLLKPQVTSFFVSYFPTKILELELAMAVCPAYYGTVLFKGLEQKLWFLVKKVILSQVGCTQLSISCTQLSISCTSRSSSSTSWQCERGRVTWAFVHTCRGKHDVSVLQNTMSEDRDPVAWRQTLQSCRMQKGLYKHKGEGNNPKRASVGKGSEAQKRIAETTTVLLQFLERRNSNLNLFIESRFHFSKKKSSFQERERGREREERERRLQRSGL